MSVFYEEAEGQELKVTCQDHSDDKWQSQDSNSSSLAPKPLLVTTTALRHNDSPKKLEIKSCECKDIFTWKSYG